jgi:hypothetical protein
LRKEYVSRTRVRWLGPIFLLFFVCNACVIVPVPWDSYLDETRQHITPVVLNSIIPGQTTKEEVFLILGEPDKASEDGSRLAYSWIKTKAKVLILAGGGYSGVAGIADINKQFIFSVTFDERNVVLEKGVHERYLRRSPEEEYPEGRLWIRVINRYDVQIDNKDFKGIINGKKINIGQFTSSNPGKSDLECPPLVFVKTPGDEAFSMYIRKAIISELNQVRAFSPQADVTITANLDSIEYVHSSTFDEKFENTGAMVTERYLVLVMTVISSNGRSLVIQEKYKIPMTPILKGETCQDLSQVFMPTVQRLIGNLIRSPEFPAMIKPLEADGGK